jgi:hypothetical protein
MREMLANLGRSLPTKGVGSSDAQSRQLLPTDGLIAQRQAWQPKVFGAATAFVFSALAPALLMTLIWNDPRIAPMVFAFTLVIALSHAVLLGLPLFLIFQSRGWMGIGTCVVLGFLIGAVPAGILTFPASAPAIYANAWAGDMPTNALNTAAIWVGYMKPLMYLGPLGALGGIVFWAVFTCSGYVGTT